MQEACPKLSKSHARVCKLFSQTSRGRVQHLPLQSEDDPSEYIAQNWKRPTLSILATLRLSYSAKPSKDLSTTSGFVPAGTTGLPRSVTISTGVSRSKSAGTESSLLLEALVTDYKSAGTDRDMYLPVAASSVAFYPTRHFPTL